MSREISLTEAKAKLNALVAWAQENDDEIVLQRRGKPAGLIVPFEYQEEFAKMRERRRREKAIARLQQIAAQVQADNSDLTQEDADRMADEVTREAIEGLRERGAISFAE
jgi:prevent-host-death family protein